MKPHGVGITLGQPPLCPLPSTPGPSGVTEPRTADPLGPVYVQILCVLSDRFVPPWAVPSKQTATTMAGLSPDNRGQSFSEPKYCRSRGRCWISPGPARSATFPTEMKSHSIVLTVSTILKYTAWWVFRIIATVCFGTTVMAPAGMLVLVTPPPLGNC